MIDTNHVLTFSDVKNMVGEPVWNADLKKWMLVEKVTDGYARMKSVNDIYLYHDYSPVDFEKFKMYRIKQVTLMDKLKEVRGEE